MSDEVETETEVNNESLENFETESNLAAQSSENSSDDEKTPNDLETVFDIPVRVTAILGRTKIPIKRLLELDQGSIVELQRKLGEAIDIYANDRLVARGEVVIVEEKIGITVTEIVKEERD